MTEIRPVSGLQWPDVGELLAYRELAYFLTWRDVKVRYKQTILGFSWAVLQPLLTMVVFSLFFGRLAKVPSDGEPYPVFVYTALVPWNLFAGGLTGASNSLVGSSNLLRKIYFPRVLIPLSVVLSSVVDFLISMSVVGVFLLYYGIPLNWRLVALLPLTLIALSACLGAGLILAAMNVKYRDVRYVVPFLVQIWMFSTPVVYPSSLLEEPWRTLYGINPMVGVVEGFRWAILGTGTMTASMGAVSSVAAVAVLGAGLLYFRNSERSFSDIV